MTVPAAGTIDFFKMWTQSGQDAERKMQKLLLTGLDTVMEESSTLASRIKREGLVANPRVRWMEEVQYGQAVTAQLATATLTITGYLQQAAVSQESIMRHIRVGTRLIRESDGVIAKVSAITGITDGSAPWACTVAGYGNTSLSDDSGPVTWRIVDEPFKDSTQVTDTRQLDRSFRDCGTQIWAESFEIFHTRKNTKYELIKNDPEHQLSALMDKMKMQLSNAMIHSLPYYDSGWKYGDEVEDPTMTGLWGWAIIPQGQMANTNVYVNKSSAILVKEDLDDIVRNLWIDEHADYDKGSWIIACHPNVHAVIADWGDPYIRTERKDKGVGNSVKFFDSKIGKQFELVPDRYMLPGRVFVMNTDAFSYGYYNGDEPWRKKLETQDRNERWLITFQTYGLVARKPRQNIAALYNVSST